MGKTRQRKGSKQKIPGNHAGDLKSGKRLPGNPQVRHEFSRKSSGRPDSIIPGSCHTGITWYKYRDAFQGFQGSLPIL